MFSQLLRRLEASPSLHKRIRLGFESTVLSAYENGICLHRQDLHDHCRQWENIKDGIWIGFCLEQDGKSLENLLKNRLIRKGNAATKNLFLYYVGDHKPPVSELSDIGFNKVVTHEDILGETGEMAFMREILGDNMDENLSRAEYKTKYRDLWAMFDYFTCLQIKRFVGNSVSTWSALQIAARNGYEIWNNSQSIPLAAITPKFPIPIVYTDTELSQPMGKTLLKISIISVREHMGETQQIHILYNGHKDHKFIKWIKEKHVVLHKQYPDWKELIEKHRLKGDQNSSHLFAHAGNYLGRGNELI